MPAVDLKDSSIIKLRSCRFVNETKDRFGVVRRAGRNRIVVRSAGLEACKRFSEGCTIREAQLHLAKRYQVAENAVDLRPLLRTLQSADLIASVDGKPIREGCPPSLYSAYRYFLRFHLKQELLRIAYQKLPLSLGRKLACWTYYLDLAAALWPKALRAEQQARRSPADCLQIPRGFARRYLSHLIQNIVDFECMQAMSPVESEKWLAKHVEYEGLEHLIRARGQGKPIIVAGFHFSTTKLLALLLMRRGFDLTQLWMPDGSVNLDTLTRKLADFQRTHSSYGKLEIIPDFTLASYKRLLQSLRNGDLLIWFADLFGSKDSREGQTEWQETTTKVFEYGEMRTELAQSKLDIALCGQRVYLNPWIGGFAKISGAAVIPASVIREGSKLRMVLLPPLQLPSRATPRHVEDLNRALFAQLDGLLRRYPEQWFGWHSLYPVPEMK